MKRTVGDISSHAVYPIQQFAVVVTLVPKIEDGQNDKRGHENSHFISPSPSARAQSDDGWAPCFAVTYPTSLIFRAQGDRPCELRARWRTIPLKIEQACRSV
jgi:hypothetical protein